MHYRASLVQHGGAGVLLTDWCKKIGIEILDLEQHQIVVDSFSTAKTLGLFFQDWHLKYAELSHVCKKEVDVFMQEIEVLDQRNEFLYESILYTLICKT